MFIDRVKVKVRGGDGGNGCISFRREKYVPKGGPDGGDGGHGGSVVFEATSDEQSLVALRYMNHYEGKRGGHGLGKGRHGAHGEDVVVKVPVGTICYDQETREILADLSEEGQQWVAAKGGKGGLGNTRFVSSVRRAPRISKPGEDGEERHVYMELKTIADVGLVGYPNAGKSTLISAVSDAHPKTASYPFTTLHPNVGVVLFPDFFRFTMADIPGLIDGAHENVGLGHEFLRHIERSRILLYVLDTAGTDGRCPLEDFHNLRKELELHKPGLTDRPSLVVANKIDEEDSRENLELLKKELEIPVYPICAVLSENTAPLLNNLRDMIEKMRSEEAAEKAAQKPSSEEESEASSGQAQIFHKPGSPWEMEQR